MADKKFVTTAFNTKRRLLTQPPVKPEHIVAAEQLSLRVVAALTHMRCTNEQMARTIVDQLGRCITSVPANLLEGWARETPRNELQFARTARGSAMEATCFLGLLVRVPDLVVGADQALFAALLAELETQVLPLIDAAMVVLCDRGVAELD